MKAFWFLMLGALLLGCGDGSTSKDDAEGNVSRQGDSAGGSTADSGGDTGEDTTDPGEATDTDPDGNNVDDWVFDGSSELAFDTTGLVSSLVLNDVDLFSDSTPSGFYLVQTEGGSETETHLSEVSTSGDEVTVSLPDGSVSFTLRVEGFGNHVALHLLSIEEGIGENHDHGLRLYLRSNEDVAFYTLNDYVTGSSRSNNTQLTINWPYLWAWPRTNGTFGSVVLYDGNKTDGDLDEVLAEIWAVQGTLGHMVHPAGHDKWTRARVLDHVERWNDKFKVMTRVALAPTSNEELYAMTEQLVLPSGANRVYFFSSIWRGEYQLRSLRNESVEGAPFPNGKADMIAYSEYLAEHGAHMQLKSLVPHLPRNDPEFFSETHCESRLMSWGSGTLVAGIGTNDTTIRFQPGPDHIWEQEDGYVRIGTEMVWADAISINASSGVWTLSNCTRGYGGTSPHAHSAGAEVVGVTHSNSHFLVQDDFGQPDSMSEEMLNPYGDFLNEVNAGHLHFDGSQIKDESPWNFRNYTDYLYGRVDQLVTGSKVGGNIPANFEKMFPLAAQAVKASSYWDIRIGIRLDGLGDDERDHAASMLDIHFDTMDRIMLNGRRPFFTEGRSGDRLTMEILENYGPVDEAHALFMDWAVLAPVYDDKDVEYVGSFLTRSGVHYRGEDVLVLSKNSDGDYIYTPHRVMGRTSGQDEPYRIDQEWGGIPRMQHITAGTAMQLYNPYEAQQPQVMIRVDPDSGSSLRNPNVSITGGGTLSVSGTVQPGEHLKYEGGATATLYDKNWNVLETLPATTTNFTVSNGNSTITTSGTGAADLRVQFITLGDEYVLETNKHL